MKQEDAITVFAPATIGNVGPGFDVLGVALEAPGDRVRARRVAEPGVRLLAVRAADPTLTILPPQSGDNTVCVAARQILETLDVNWGIELELDKGLPVGSGLGSSGASAVAGAVAVNALAGAPLTPAELLPACLAAEEVACAAAHGDNVAPGLFGGFVLLRGDGVPIPLRTPLTLWVALVTPQQSLSTRQARAVIPDKIPLREAIHNSAQLATLIYGVATGDLDALAVAIDDRIAEPRRAPLIPGFAAVKRAALKAGALGASIAGAGPTIFALCAKKEVAKSVSQAMGAALKGVGIAGQIRVTAVARDGARVIRAGEVPNEA
ncbi:MAG: homoserine kinase [Deltaproteobacteria bacterium]|nr:homoserine kinase [Deltaproteobacteria bacterium]